MKKQIFTIQGIINETTKNEFKTFLRGTKDNELIEIYFNCWGGNNFYGKVMETYIYYIKKYYPTRRFIHYADVAASAAFTIFARGHERIITRKSIIQPHLPEPNDFGKHVTAAQIAREQVVAIKGITSTLPLVQSADIFKYNDFPFPLEFMVNKQVVTKVVSKL